MYDFCLTIPYGVMLGVGGLVGFASSGSFMSGIFGIGSGAALTTIGYLSYQNFVRKSTVPKIWPSISCVISTALTGILGYRYLLTNKFFPAGFITFTSAGMTAFYIHLLLRKPHSDSKKL
uniref:Uncharacterized protein AlNc14C982G12689 n=1 Tax=Albugo laibachii Nc14 TaxID=890382 RepID=F0X2D7_9STRA|nr:conserved hypothetical protein [Albugo laibachii Nc14]|eukprot:CCA28023.1 conserved hypothetical protein [Albugo laibachii Nc14]